MIRILTGVKVRHAPCGAILRQITASKGKGEPQAGKRLELTLGALKPLMTKAKANHTSPAPCVRSAMALATLAAAATATPPAAASSSTSSRAACRRSPSTC